MFGAEDPESLKLRGFCAAFAGLFLIGLWLSHWQYAFGHLSPCPKPSSASADAARIGDEPPMPTISTPEEFNVALRSRRCVMFVDADWSPTAIMGRRVLYPVVRSWKTLSVSFFRVDVTDVDDAMADRLASIGGIHWLSGSGQVLFVRSGELIDFVECAASETRATLLERVEQLLR